MSLRIGDQILEGKYRILDVTDEGAFGKVYLADDVPLKRKVAIKELRREDWTEEQYVQCRDGFQKEAQIGSALREGNAVGVYTLAPVGKEFYLVMEYVDGPDFQKPLEEQGPQPMQGAVEIAIDVCDGLAAIHDHPLGIVRRDIKPPNILLTSQGQPEITDFGLARLYGESLRSLAKGATHPGTAPACLQSKKQAPGTCGQHRTSTLSSACSPRCWPRRSATKPEWKAPSPATGGLMCHPGRTKNSTRCSQPNGNSAMGERSTQDPA